MGAHWRIITIAALAHAAVIAGVVDYAAFGHGIADWIQQRKLSDPVSKYPCCGPTDCDALDPSQVKETAAGYLIVPTGETIARERIIWGTPDGRPWRCRMTTGATRCLILPDPSV